MPSEAAPELLACPFCGATDAGFHLQASETRNLSGEISGYAVECDECAGFGPHRTTKEEAHTAWNTRLASASAPDGELAAYRSDVLWWLEIATGKGYDSITAALTAAPQPPVVGDGRCLAEIERLCDEGAQAHGDEFYRPIIAEIAKVRAALAQPAEERMREAAAKVADDAAAMMRAHGSLSFDREFAGAWTMAEEIAAAIRSLPLTKEPRDDQ